MPEAQVRELITRYQEEVSHEHHHLHLKGHTMKRATEGGSEMDLAGFFALLFDPDLNPLHPGSKVCHSRTFNCSDASVTGSKVVGWSLG